MHEHGEFDHTHGGFGRSHHGPHAHRGMHGMRGMSFGGGRARRGDVRAAIVSLLRESDMHGYEIIQQVSDRSNGAWNPSPGAIYPALQALEAEGLIVSRDEGGKRVFSLTDAGHEHAATLPEEGPWAEMSDQFEPSGSFREAFHGLVGAAMQVGRTGTPEQVEETAKILNDARKRIYTMLAGE